MNAEDNRFTTDHPTLAFVDLRDRTEEPDFRDLLELSIGFPNSDKLDAITKAYRESEIRRLFGFADGARIVALLGLEIVSRESVILRHLAVAPEWRLRGVGSHLIREAMRRLGARHAEAETDDEAVEFYRRCGFNAISLGERYPGVVRYRVTLDLND